jgi:dihydrofolate synthase/folylpolyglutamate synthase
MSPNSHIQSSYSNSLKEMFSLRRFGIKLGLSTIKTILTNLGNPQDGFKSIHVAGTNGKGSIASAIASIFHQAGFKVGLYTSPHLIRFNERIRINQEPISDEETISAYEAVKQAPYGTRQPTFFEFSTAMALYQFGKQNVEWAIIETGMGGRLDATNVIKPVVSIITNISIEHKMYLGNTIAQIAKEKGGIIKEKTPVVTGIRQKSAIAVIREIAAKKLSPVYRLGDDFNVTRNPDGTFDYLGIKNRWQNMHSGLLGDYQVDNAALALAVCEILMDRNVALPVKSIKEGLARNKWPGRLEVASTTPYVLIDGAHNLVAAQHLGHFLRTNLAGRPITLVVGILDDKPYAAMLRALLPVCQKVILTRPKINRSLPTDILHRIAKTIISDIRTISDVGDAVKYAIEHASPNDVICIAGSLYVVGEAKKALADILPSP